MALCPREASGRYSRWFDPFLRDRDQGLTTYTELQTRIEELEALENRMESVGVSIAKAVSEGISIVNSVSYLLDQEMDIRDLNLELANLKSTIKSVPATQDATATLYKEWRNIESTDVIIERGLSNLLSSGRTQRERLENKKILKANEAAQALEMYYEQGE